MRAFAALTVSAAMLLAQVPVGPAYAEVTPPAPQVPAKNSAIAATFKVFPNGGDELSLRLMNLILANPKLAPDLVIYMRNTPDLNRAQKLAAEHALATAADRLGVQAADLALPKQQGLNDPWFVALSILAVAPATCIAGCGTENNPNIPQAAILH